jgi:RimJ/RimL family protein N-acetyltransferase
MERKKECLQTKRLLLKALTESDEQPMLDIFFNEDIKATYMIPDFKDENAFLKTFSHLKKLSLDENGHTAGVFLGDELIGLFHKVDINGDRVEVGYVIHPNYWNQGYATEALQAGIGYFFEKGFSEVYAGAFKTNPASTRVMEKAGMKKTNMKASVRYRGEMHPCVYYSIKR